MPAAPADTAEVTAAKQKFMDFYNNLPVDNYLPVAPADTPEVQEAREAFLTFYKNEQQEQKALAEAAEKGRTSMKIFEIAMC